MPADTRVFLTRDEVAELSGIRAGRNHKTREQLQVDWLRTSGIPFVVNARGCPIITVAAVEGRQPTDAPKKGWSPTVMQSRGA